MLVTVGLSTNVTAEKKRKEKKRKEKKRKENTAGPHWSDYFTGWKFHIKN